MASFGTLERVCRICSQALKSNMSVWLAINGSRIVWKCSQPSAMNLNAAESMRCVLQLKRPWFWWIAAFTPLR